MVDRRRTVAVVLAGGTGTRVGLGVPKQLIKVAGKPIIEHTLAVFEASPLIDEVIVMMAPGHLDEVRAIVRRAGLTKTRRILEGGGTRNDTTRAALAELASEPDDCKVVVHDAVRPLLSESIIEANVAALDEYDAVDTAIPSADTVIRVREDRPEIEDVLPRAALRRGQTPQSFRLDVLRAAYDAALADPSFVATDDCTVVLRYLPDVPIAVVPGHDRNMKVTEPIDVHLADKLFQLGSSEAPPLAGGDYATVLAGRTVVVFGGSYGIGRAVAELAASHGADVHCFSRTTGTHVERRADIAAAAEQVLAASGRVDLVVNAAGVLPRGDLVEASEETVVSSTEVNYLAPVFIAQEFLPALQDSKGSLLLFTSSSYTRGRAGYALYSSAKAAVVNLTQALADEWSPWGVRVNCLNPERTATPMRTAAFGAEPPGSLLEAEVVAQHALDVLLSGQTGQVFDVRRQDLESTQA